MGDRDDFDEDEELLMVTGSRSKSAGKKRHRKASDSDDDDDPPARAEKAATNKRRATAADSEDDENEYGMDDEERQKLAGMNELEREMYLFEREERLQRQREREQVINQARSKDQEQVEVRASSRRKQATTGADSAIGKIAAAHAQREERAKKKKQEEEEKQEQRRREKRQQEEEQEAEEDEYEEEEEAEEDEEELASADEGLSDLELEAVEPTDARQAKQLGARAEAYDEGAGSYEEAEERATLEDIMAITLKRSDLEAWHNEPFFEEDVRGCVLRVVNQQPQHAEGQPQYLMCRVADIVVRNSYAFPTTTKNSRTRKWLHLDDMSGHGVFRHQMTMVSNSPITEQEYKKALGKSEAAHTKFITKGDVEQAKERLKHARTFKYDSSLVKTMLEKKRAAGKLTGNTAQLRAKLKHELNVAQQEGKPEEEVQRIQDELVRLEQQQASSRQGLEEIMQQALQEKDADRAAELASQLPTDMALALINQRNKKLNNYKLVTSGVAKAVAQEAEGGARDVFARRHTQSKVYWSTRKKDDGDIKAAAAAVPAAILKRQSSGVTTLSLLKGDKKNMDPAELIKVLDLTIDMSRLPQTENGRAAESMLPKRLLGLRWIQSVEKRQQELAGRSLLSLDDWKRKMDLQQIMK